MPLYPIAYLRVGGGINLVWIVGLATRPLLEFLLEAGLKVAAKKGKFGQQ